MIEHVLQYYTLDGKQLSLFERTITHQGVTNLAMHEYNDFDIHIRQRQGDYYPVSVYRAEGGDVEGKFRLPFPVQDLELKRTQVENVILRSANPRLRVSLSQDEQFVRKFGEALFKALFSGAVRSCYQSSQVLARERGRGLRIRLHIDAPELTVLPWEFLFDRGDFVTLSNETPLVRYIRAPQAQRPMKVTGKLRILGMVANPKNEAQLNVAAEQKRLAESLAPLIKAGAVELVWLNGSTHSALQEQLWHGPWHIFHFIGHGYFKVDADEGYLIFCDDAGRAAPVSATHLARLLGDHTSLRLVVLNACQSATGGKDTSSSVANVLVQKGLAAVVAMQFPISDEAALAFSSVFYRAIAAALPVDKAIAEARKSLAALDGYVEWGTPVLAMRAPNGRLFDLPTRTSAGRPKDKEPTRRDPMPPTAPRNLRGSNEDGRFTALLAEGNAYFEVAEFGRALNSYEQAVQLNPSSAEAFYRRGRARYALGEHELALADYQRSIALDPTFSRGYNGRGNYRLGRGDFAGALADYDKAIQLDPKDSYPYLNRARLRYDQREYTAALADAERSIALSPNDSLGFVMRAQIQIELGKTAQASADLERAVTINKRESAAYFWRAHIAQLASQHEQAVADYSQYIKLWDKDWAAYCNRGISFLNLGRHAEAEADFLAAQKLAPSVQTPWVFLGMLRVEQKRAEEGLALFSQVLAKEPDNVEALCGRGQALMALGKQTEALKLFDEALKRDPNRLDAHFDRGRLLWNMNRLKDALAEFTWVIGRQPLGHPAYFNRAGIRWDLGDLQGALEDFNAVVKLAPRLARGYRRRCQLLFQLKQYAASRDDALRAVELEPGQAEDQYHLARALAQLNDIPGALKAIGQAINVDASSPDYLSERAQLLTSAATRDKARRRQLLTDALSDMNKAVRLRANDEALLQRRAYIYLELDDTQKAIADLQAALKVTSDASKRKVILEQIEKSKKKEKPSWWPF